MKTKKAEMNKIITTIITNNAMSGQMTVDDETARIIRELIKLDFRMLDPFDNSQAQELTRFFKKLGFTEEEVKQMIPNYSKPFYDVEAVSFIGSENGDAMAELTAIYNLFNLNGYFQLPQAKNLLNLEKFKNFISAYYDGEVRYNVITGETDLVGFKTLYKRFESVKDNYVKQDLMIKHIVDEAYTTLKEAYSGYTRELLIDYINILAQANSYNPVLDLLKSNKWDGQDRLNMVYQYLQQDEDLKQTLIRKWLIQCVAMLHNTGDREAEGILTIVGPQGVGKTAFFRNIVPNHHWMKSIESFDPDNKDKIMKATTTWIGELAEVEEMYKRDQGALKNFITSTVDEYRKPYDRSMTKAARIASYGATVNRTDFISDDSARRWWVIKMNKPNDYQAMHKLNENALQIWLQVYNIYTCNPDGYRLTRDEMMSVIKANNQNFSKALPYEEELKEYYSFIPNSEDYKELKDVWKTFYMDGIVNKADNREKRVLASTLKVLCNRYGVKVNTVHGMTRYYIINKIKEEEAF